jgi:uncharacterized repeat protein (TIGR01451 family)
MTTTTVRLWCAALIALMAGAAGLAQSSSPVLELISVSSAEVQGNAASGVGAGFVTPSGARTGVTPDARFVGFVSFADNLVPGDTNMSADVFVRDRLAGTTERVSVTSRGREGNNHSGITSERVDLSDDGRFVAFDSEATNLVRNDDNARAEVLVRDRFTRTTELISRGLDGNPATGDSPAISADGRFVAFISGGQNLVAGHPEFDTNDHAYVFDRQTQTMERVDVNGNGELGVGSVLSVDISADGRFVAFDSLADNLEPGVGDQNGFDVFVRDRTTGTTTGISTVGDTGTFEGHCFLSSISANGRFVGFTATDSFDGDTNGSIDDAVVADRQLGTVRIVSRNNAGEQADDESETAFVSDDGIFAVFSSRGSNVVAGDANGQYDVFRRNLVLGTTERLAGDDDAFSFPAIGSGMTPDGLVVALITGGTLLATDANNAFDVYVADTREPGDLSVIKADSPDPVTARSNLTYTISVQNLGPGHATGVMLTDQLPDATFVSATASQGSCTRTGGGKADGLVTCDLGTINAFASATVTIVVTPTRAGTLTNTASVTAGTPDPGAANNTSTATTTVAGR